MQPYIHYAFYTPLNDTIGLYAGAGGSYVYAVYELSGGRENKNYFTLDLTAGIFFWNSLELSYTLRSDFASASNKVSVGYVYRFK